MNHHEMITALVRGIAPSLHEHVKREIEQATAPLKAEIEVLKALVGNLRPPADPRERGHGDDSRGPNLSEWQHRQ